MGRRRAILSIETNNYDRLPTIWETEYPCTIKEQLEHGDWLQFKITDISLHRKKWDQNRKKYFSKWEISGDLSKGMPTLNHNLFWSHLDNLDFHTAKMIAFKERFGWKIHLPEGRRTCFQAVQDLVGRKLTQNIRTPSEKNDKTRVGTDFRQNSDFHWWNWVGKSLLSAMARLFLVIRTHDLKTCGEQKYLDPLDFFRKLVKVCDR